MKSAIRRLVRAILDSRGTSVTEVLLAATMLPIVLGSSYLALDFSLTSWQATDYKTEALSSARLLSDAMGRDLRQAERPLVSLDTSGNAFVVFAANINPTAGSERMRYQLSGSVITRSVDNPNVSNPLSPVYDGWDETREMAKIVRNREVTPNIKLFSFYKADGTELAPGGDVRLVKVVKIDVLIRSPHARNDQSVRVTANIKLRNF